MAIKAIKLILRCLLSAFVGGVAALCVLALVCVAIDLFAWLQDPPPVSESDIAGSSGDSTFGNSALIFFLIYSPLVALGGLLLFSAPMYYLFFAYGWPRKLPFIWLTVLGASLIQLFSIYITATFDRSIAHASVICGLIFASLVVFARDKTAMAPVSWKSRE